MGYTPNAKQSLIAHKWLSYLSEKNDVYIQHARDGGEKRGYCEGYWTVIVKRFIRHLNFTDVFGTVSLFSLLVFSRTKC